MTRQLLTFSRPELCSPTRVELHEFLPALVKSYRRVLPDDISIVAHTDQDLAILMDEGHLSQVLLNIVLNARDAMPTGGTLALTAEFRSRDALPPAVAGFHSGAVEIDVTDTGTGMDEETRSRVFEPFFTTKGTRGTGLGLVDCLWRRSAGARRDRHPERAGTGHVGEAVLSAADRHERAHACRRNRARHVRPSGRLCCWLKMIGTCVPRSRGRSDRPAIASSRWATSKPDAS